MAGLISTRTAICGVILHPAGHTRSPAMHTAAFEELGVDARYHAFDVPPDQLAGAIVGMRVLGIRQLAVSIPHKLTVMALVDEVEETARRIGAVNTITREGDRLVGTNSDWQGAIAALEEQAGANLSGSRAVVLGAGGAARAAVFGLRRQGATVIVLNRTEAKAVDLAASLDATSTGPLEALADLDYDILVNTTSVGLKEDLSPVPPSSIREGSIVMDAVYDPTETKLLRDAKTRGAQAVQGKWWLVHQAAAQLEAWTHRQAPTATMAKAFDDAEEAAAATSRRIPTSPCSL
ncbi:MAG: shikimate dehydrogenase [Myxococcota bacterium]|nr:shikimate dehydrogenase [Myxococcota bacterium]